MIESCRRPSVKPAWPLQVPEPDAEGLAQLQDMGFSAGLASKALLLSHNVPAAALEWALQHSGDADADAPASEDALRAGGARAPGAGPPRTTTPVVTLELAVRSRSTDHCSARLRIGRFQLAMIMVLQDPQASHMQGVKGPTGQMWLVCCSVAAAAATSAAQAPAGGARRPAAGGAAGRHGLRPRAGAPALV